MLEGDSTLRESTVRSLTCRTRMCEVLTAAQCLFCCSITGSEKRKVELKNRLPANIVPNTAVERMLTINGEARNGALVLSYRASTGQAPQLSTGRGERIKSELVLRMRTEQDKLEH